MATTYTVGTSGRTYSTIQAAEDAIPATPTGGYELHLYNDSEFTAGVTISGHTTSATNYIKLTAAAGQSFADHASKATNPLFYDQSKGVGIAATPSDEGLIYVDGNDYVTIDRLQIKMTGEFGGAEAVELRLPNTNTLLKDCIVAKTASSTNTIVAARDAKVVNCLIYDTGATASNNALTFFELGQSINNTVVRSGSAGGQGMTRNYSTCVCKNTAVFGWTTAFGSTTWGSGSGYNATDAGTAPGSNNQVSKTFANQFESTTADYRVKAGADLIDLGNTDASYPNDIIGTVRGTTTAGDIGAWEYANAPATPSLLLPQSLFARVPALRMR